MKKIITIVCCLLVIGGFGAATPITPVAKKQVWKLADGFITPSWSAPLHHCGNGVCEAQALSADGLIEFEDEFWCPLDCPTAGYSTYKQGQFYTVAKPEFEYFAKAVLNDMQYCHALINDYLGIEFRNNPTVYFINASDIGVKFVQSGNGGNTYIFQNLESALAQDNLEIMQGQADNFWVKSSPTYCSNAHELVHSII